MRKGVTFRMIEAYMGPISWHKPVFLLVSNWLAMLGFAALCIRFIWGLGPIPEIVSLVALWAWGYSTVLATKSFWLYLAVLRHHWRVMREIGALSPDQQTHLLYELITKPRSEDVHPGRE